MSVQGAREEVKEEREVVEEVSEGAMKAPIPPSHPLDGTARNQRASTTRATNISTITVTRAGARATWRGWPRRSRTDIATSTESIGASVPAPVTQKAKAPSSHTAIPEATDVPTKTRREEEEEEEVADIGAETQKQGGTGKVESASPGDIGTAPPQAARESASGREERGFASTELGSE